MLWQLEAAESARWDHTATVGSLVSQATQAIHAAWLTPEGEKPPRSLSFHEIHPYRDAAEPEEGKPVSKEETRQALKAWAGKAKFAWR